MANSAVRRPRGGGAGIERDRRAGGLVQGPVVQGRRPGRAAACVAAVRRGAVPAGAAGTRLHADTHSVARVTLQKTREEKKRTAARARARVGEKTKKQSGRKGREYKK